MPKYIMALDAAYFAGLVAGYWAGESDVSAIGPSTGCSILPLPRRNGNTV